MMVASSPAEGETAVILLQSRPSIEACNFSDRQGGIPMLMYDSTFFPGRLLADRRTRHGMLKSVQVLSNGPRGNSGQHKLRRSAWRPSSVLTLPRASAELLPCI